MGAVGVEVKECERLTCAAMRWGRRCCTAAPSPPVHVGQRGSAPSAPAGEGRYASRSGSSASTRR